MSKDDKHLSKKEKKALQRQKNRKQWELFTQFRQMQEADERAVEGREAAAQPGPAPERAEQAVDAPDLAVIRSRITGRRMEARERWNRYAGTSGGGGRGR